MLSNSPVLKKILSNSTKRDENHEFDSVEKVTREFFVSPANSQDTSLITGMIRFDFYDYD